MSEDIHRRDLRSVLEALGATEIPEGGWRKVKCYFHNDSRPSAVVNTDEDAFRCFACGVKGDSIALLMIVEGLDYVGAFKRYEEIVGPEGPTISQSIPRKSRGTVSVVARDYERGCELFPDWFRGKS